MQEKTNTTEGIRMDVELEAPGQPNLAMPRQWSVRLLMYKSIGLKSVTLFRHTLHKFQYSNQRS